MIEFLTNLVSGLIYVTCGAFLATYIFERYYMRRTLDAAIREWLKTDTGMLVKEVGIEIKELARKLKDPETQKLLNEGVETLRKVKLVIDRLEEATRAKPPPKKVVELIKEP